PTFGAPRHGRVAPLNPPTFGAPRHGRVAPLNPPTFGAPRHSRVAPLIPPTFEAPRHSRVAPLNSTRSGRPAKPWHPLMPRQAPAGRVGGLTQDRRGGPA